MSQPSPKITFHSEKENDDLVQILEEIQQPETVSQCVQLPEEPTYIAMGSPQEAQNVPFVQQQQPQQNGGAMVHQGNEAMYVQQPINYFAPTGPSPPQDFQQFNYQQPAVGYEVQNGEQQQQPEMVITQQQQGGYSASQMRMFEFMAAPPHPIMTQQQQMPAQQMMQPYMAMRPPRTHPSGIMKHPFWDQPGNRRDWGPRSSKRVIGGKRQMSRKSSYNSKWGIKIFVSFLKRNNVDADPKKLTGQQLANLLPLFFRGCRKVSGGLYAPNSLTNIRAMLSSYFRMNHPAKLDVVNGSIFRRANEVFEDQVRKSKICEQSLTTASISNAHLQQLIDSGTFATDRYASLVAKVWFDLTRHFSEISLPQSEWTRDMLRMFFDDSRDSFYVTWYTPYDDGQENRMYENKDEDCPVGSLVYYDSLLGTASNLVFQKDGSLDGRTWFGDGPIDEEDLNYMMPIISQRAELPIKYTNESVLRMAVTTRYSPRVTAEGNGVCVQCRFQDVLRIRGFGASPASAASAASPAATAAVPMA